MSLGSGRHARESVRVAELQRSRTVVCAFHPADQKDRCLMSVPASEGPVRRAVIAIRLQKWSRTDMRRQSQGAFPKNNRTMRRLGGIGLVGVFAFASATPASALGQSFESFGFAPGLDVSEARGISDDGRTVVVQSFDSAQGGGPGTVGLVGRADTRATTPVGLLPGANFSTGFAISGDGRSVVGASGTWGTPFQAYRLERGSSSPLIGLGDLPGGRFASQAFAVSRDGGVVVGFGEVDGPISRGFRWTSATGMVELRVLPGNNLSTAFGISRDGRTAVGYSGDTTTFRFEPTAWTPNGTPRALGLLAGSFGRANDVSDNGVVVGASSSPNTSGPFFTEATRWTASGGPSGLGDLPGGDFFSTAEAVSADGAVIVGASFTEAGLEAFLWTERTGMIPLADYLTGAGVNLKGWTLTSAYDVTPDGRTFVGVGVNPSGQSEGWVATVRPSCGDNVATVFVDADGRIVGGALDGARYRGALLGTSGADVMVGTDRGDLVLGLGGPDTICGLRGRDVLSGGLGADLLFGDEGRDRLFGGPGADVLDGGPGRDRCRGGLGRNHRLFCER